jgi:hypothetical protein
MKRPRTPRLAALPHAQRVALRECILRGAARNYAGDAGTTEEEGAAEELRDAALDYAVAVFQRAAFEAGPAPTRGPRSPRKGNASSSE